MSYRNSPDKSTQPVWKESNFSNDTALCANESDSISARRTDVRPAGQNVYKIGGKVPRGSSNKEGVRNERDTISEGICQVFDLQKD